jgi:hypothetical protein
MNLKIGQEVSVQSTCNEFFAGTVVGESYGALTRSPVWIVDINTGDDLWFYQKPCDGKLCKVGIGCGTWIDPGPLDFSLIKLEQIEAYLRSRGWIQRHLSSPRWSLGEGEHQLNIDLYPSSIERVLAIVATDECRAFADVYWDWLDHRGRSPNSKANLPEPTGLSPISLTLRLPEAERDFLQGLNDRGPQVAAYLLATWGAFEKFLCDRAG